MNSDGHSGQCVRSLTMYNRMYTLLWSMQEQSFVTMLCVFRDSLAIRPRELPRCLATTYIAFILEPMCTVYVALGQTSCSVGVMIYHGNTVHSCTVCITDQLYYLSSLPKFLFASRLMSISTSPMTPAIPLDLNGRESLSELHYIFIMNAYQNILCIIPCT